MHSLFLLLPLATAQPAIALVVDHATDKVEFVNDARKLPSFFNLNPEFVKSGFESAHAEMNTLRAKKNRSSEDETRLQSYQVVERILEITQKNFGRERISSDESLHFFSLEQTLCKLSGQAETQTPFTELQYLALCLYTGDDYKHINGELLRSHGLPLKLKKVIASLDSALASLPDFTGTVWSGRNVSAATAATYSVGQVMQFDLYLSTSSSTPWPGNLQLVIHSTHGKDIHQFSRVPQENEVLMPRGSRFRIESVNVAAPGQTRLILQQL